LLIFLNEKLGAIGNPSYLEDRGWEDHGLRPAEAKFSKTHPMVMVTSTRHPQYLGSINRRIVIQAGPGKNGRLYSKNKAKQIGDVVQVAGYQPDRHEALSSTAPVPRKHKRKETGKNESSKKHKLMFHNPFVYSNYCLHPLPPNVSPQDQYKRKVYLSTASCLQLQSPNNSEIGIVFHKSFDTQT
jgi:hypothetical protein